MNSPTVIDINSAVSIGVLIGTLPLLAGCFLVWFQVRGMRKDIKRAWTIPAMRVWSERLSSHNPKLDLQIPDVDEVVRTFNGAPK